jgi:hypothetical protein
MLHFFSPFVRAHADKAFLATCRCKDGVCSCNYDGFHKIHSNKGSKMPNLLDSLSAADRKRLADQILSLPHDQQRELVAQLGSIVDMSAKAEGEKTQKKNVLAALNAARSDKHLGSKNALGLIDGSLRRAGVEPLESLAMKSSQEINSILASATRLESKDRFAVKSFLFRIGAIPK